MTYIEIFLAWRYVKSETLFISENTITDTATQTGDRL